jgi:hypothetical protein
VRPGGRREIDVDAVEHGGCRPRPAQPEPVGSQTAASGEATVARATGDAGSLTGAGASRTSKTRCADRVSRRRVLCREGDARDGFQNGDRREHRDRECRRAQRAVGDGRRPDGHGADEGQGEHRDAECGREPRPPRRGALRGSQPRVERRDGSQPLLVRAERDQLRRCLEQLRDGGRQRPAQVGDPALGTGRQCRRHQWHAEARDEDGDEEQRAGRRQHREDDAHPERTRGETRNRRQHCAQPQVGHRLDVGHDAPEQVAAAERRQPGRRQALERAVRGDPRIGEQAQRGVVTDEPLGVAQHGTADAKGPHGDDRDRQLQHRRLLGGARDQPRRHRHQADARPQGGRAEKCGGEQATDRRPAERHRAREPAHGASPSRSGASMRTTRSHAASGAGRCETSRTVRPGAARRTASTTAASVSSSRSSVGSSSSTSAASRSKARASEMRRR